MSQYYELCVTNSPRTTLRTISKSQSKQLLRHTGEQIANGTHIISFLFEKLKELDTIIFVIRESETHRELEEYVTVKKWCELKQ